MDQFTDEVEADLQRYYGVDLRDLWRGGLSLRRVGVLIVGLPPESLTMSALLPMMPEQVESDKPDRQWSTEAQLLASVVDAVTSLTHVYVAGHSKTSPPRWQPIKRPSDKRQPQIRRMTQAQREALQRRTGGRNGD